MLNACGINLLSVALFKVSIAGNNRLVTMTSAEGQDVALKRLHVLQILDGHSQASIAWRCPGCTVTFCPGHAQDMGSCILIQPCVQYIKAFLAAGFDVSRCWVVVF